MQDETDKYIKDTWEEFFYIECAHLKKATEMLEKYETEEQKDQVPIDYENIKKAKYELIEEDDEDMRVLMDLLKMHLIPADEVHLTPDLFK